MSLKERQRRHKKASEKGAPGPLSSAIRKYGWDSIEWQVVYEDVPNDELDRLEFETIEWFGTLCPRGYNVSPGGNTRKGWVPSQESIARGLETKKKNGYYGPSAETIAKIRASNMGKNKGKSSPNKGKTRKHLTAYIEELRAKQRAGWTLEKRRKFGEKRIGKSFLSQSAREKLRVTLKEQWKDPEFREKKLAGHRAFSKARDWDSCAL